jgi:NAD(P)-dependent dehydrogenase (short-subunit alcohol dehydrogenase family)
MTPTTLVTGVSKGIGRAIAERLAADGHHVLGLARTAPDWDFKGSFHAVDLLDVEATRALVERLAEDRAITGLVHNAGTAHIARLEKMTLAQFDEMTTLHLRAAAVMVQALAPGMRARRFGRIVLVGSRAALGKVGRGAYAATKAAMTGFARSWALEFGADGITVNCVAPGPTATELFMRGNPPEAPATKAIIASIPLGRLGKPEEMASAVAYFLREDAGFTTGQTLYVCGGLTVGLYPG